jgi:hypothetical protein
MQNLANNPEVPSVELTAAKANPYPVASTRKQVRVSGKNNNSLA